MGTSVEKYKEEGSIFIAQAQAFEIKSREDYGDAEIIREKALERKKGIKKLLDPVCEAAHKAHKHHTSLRGGLIKPFDEVVDILNTKMIEFHASEASELAEKQRIEDEKAKAEAVQKAQENGNTGLSEAIKDGLVPVVAEPIAQEKPDKTSIVEKWGFKVTDISKIDRKYLMVNEKLIQKDVDKLKQRTRIEGIEVFPKHNIKSKPKKLSKTHW